MKLVKARIQDNAGSMKELFKNWNGVYHIPEDLKDWDNVKPEGKEFMVEKRLKQQ